MIALGVIGDGRGDYLHEAVQAVRDYTNVEFGARIMVDDSGDPEYGELLDHRYPEFRIVHGGRRGMAGAVQAGWDALLTTDADYVLWIEEDMVLTRHVPIAEAVDVLEMRPTVAQMCFKREAIDPSEGDDQLGAILDRASFWKNHVGYFTHDFIFSMNPCLIPRRILKMGWPAGNEAGMTQKLLDAGYVFGQWGYRTDKPWGYHVGYARRTAGWAL